MAIGLERLRLRSHSIVHDIGALVIGALTLAAIVFGLVLTLNPMLTGDRSAAPFFNLILLGYGIPAVLAGDPGAGRARDTRPLAYRYIAATTAVDAGASLYLTLEVRTLYPRRRCSARGTDQRCRAIHLFGGVAASSASCCWSRASCCARSRRGMASAAVVALTIGKVFLIDMAGLTGIFRALSFIGLGVVLVGIGWLYQRLLFPARGKVITPEASGAGNGDE